MKLMLTIMLSVFAVSCGTAPSMQNMSTTSDAESHWSDIGSDAPGHSILDIRNINVLDGTDSTGLNGIVSATGKTKAVIQVVELLPSGGICGGCLNKANEIVRAIRRDRSVSGDTTYVMVLSTSYTPTMDHVRYAQRRVDRGVKIVRDIEGAFQSTFARGNSPATLVLESQYRGKVLNMHGQQASAAIRALRNLPSR